MDYQFIYSGPLLFKSTLNEEDKLALLKICLKHKKIKYNEKLAGVITDEYRIEDLNSLKNILRPYLENFMEAVNNWYGLSQKQLTLTTAWTNFMKPGEFNPPHTHSNCNFSSVFYLKVSNKIIKEGAKHVGTGSRPGNINFMFGPPVDGYIAMYDHAPKEGDFFIFPNTLIHNVNPFKTKNAARISMAINFDVRDSIQASDYVKN